jgi:hypothetical protein
MIREVPFHASGYLLGYALVVTEEVTDCIAVVYFVELVDVVDELAFRPFPAIIG